ncbi:MAG TPA: hypothetical protein VKT82_24480 [Ktedonobacterales bacterium]|nr:hypothetical protein [Ktedonobacterales bacterium]
MSWNRAQPAPVDDPLAAYQGKPVISRGGANQHYLGRVVVELWDDGSPRDDAHKLALSSDAVDGQHAKLCQRIAAAFPARVQSDGASTSSALSSATSPEGWVTTTAPVDDPLAAYQGKPVISRGGANQHYLGRVVVELWDDGSQPDDSSKLTISSDAVDGDHLRLRERIAQALPECARQAPFTTPS